MALPVSFGLIRNIVCGSAFGGQVTSERLSGQSLKSTWPLAPNITLQAASEVKLQQVDCVFLCLPHTHSAKIAAKVVEANVRVIDLSAALRLNTAEDFEYWYNEKHAAPDLLPSDYVQIVE